MGTALLHALPRERTIFASTEGPYGVLVQPVAADGVKVLAANLGSPAIERVTRADNRSTRSIVERITGKGGPVEWSVEGYLIPSGAAGTPPDWGPALIKAAMGVETINGGVSVVYTLGETQGQNGSLSLHDNTSKALLESIAGVFVDEFAIKGTGGDPVRITAAGMGSTHQLTGRSTLDGALSGGESAATVDDPENYEEGSLIQIGTSDGAGAGHAVSDVTGSVLTFSPTVTGAQADESVVAPFTPTPTTAGSPLPGIAGSLTIDAEAFPVTSYEVTLKNNFEAHHDEAFQQFVTDYHENIREVRGQVTVRAREDQIKRLGQRKAFATHPFVFTIGTVAGKILTMSLPTVEFEFAPVDKPESGTAMINIPFLALAPSGGDELSLTFT